MKTICLRIVAGAAMLTLASGAFYSAMAHDDAKGIVKERMDAMKVMGGAMKQVAAMMKGEKPFDGAAVSQAAMAINEQSGKIAKMFPKDGKNHDSYALPIIWVEWDEFTSMAGALEEASEKLSDSAFDGSKMETMPFFVGVSKKCKACHTKFRRPKEK